MSRTYFAHGSQRASFALWCAQQRRRLETELAAVEPRTRQARNLDLDAGGDYEVIRRGHTFGGAPAKHARPVDAPLPGRNLLAW